MLGWIDQRLRQESSMIDATYGGLNAIMVGVIAQFTPVLYRSLYSPSTEDPMSGIEFLVYRDLDHVVKLDRNRRAS